MENLFWNLRCFSCNKALRISATESQLGHTVEVSCPDCGAKTKTIIGVSEPNRLEEPLEFHRDLEGVPKKVKKAVGDILRAAKNNQEIRQAVQSIRDEGFGLGLIIGLFRKECADNTNLELKVDSDGEIKPGTFSEEDEKELLKKFKIKL